MWITYSCDGKGIDETKAHIPPRPQIQCSATPGRMVSKDIPLDGGWIKIGCASDRRTNPCIKIHKVRVACNGGNPIQTQMNLVRKC